MFSSSISSALRFPQKHTDSLNYEWILYCSSLTHIAYLTRCDFTRNSDALKSEMLVQLLDGFSFNALDGNANILVSIINNELLLGLTADSVVSFHHIFSCICMRWGNVNLEQCELRALHGSSLDCRLNARHRTIARIPCAFSCLKY